MTLIVIYTFLVIVIKCQALLWCIHLQCIEIIYIYLWVFFLFQTSGPENRVNTKDFKDADWLFPETTKNFTKLPLQYRVIKSFIIIGQKNFEDIIKAYRLIYSKWCNRLLINVAICINWYKHDIPIFKNNIQTCNHPTSIEIINISPTGLLCSVPSKLWPASDPVQPRGGGAEVQRPLLRLLQ